MIDVAEYPKPASALDALAAAALLAVCLVGVLIFAPWTLMR